MTPPPSFCPSFPYIYINFERTQAHVISITTLSSLPKLSEESLAREIARRRMSASSVVLVFLLLASAGLTSAARGGAMLSSVPSTMIPLFPDSQEHVAMRRPFHRKGDHVFGGKQLRNCMPKGLRHSSAPSRYANYEPLGSSARCFTPSPPKP